LKQQNDILRKIQEEIGGIHTEIAVVNESQNQTHQQLKRMKQQSDIHGDMLIKFGDRIQVLETDVSDLTSRLHEVQILSAKVEEQKRQGESLDRSFKEHKHTANEFISRAKVQLENQSEVIEQSESRLNDLEGHVKHFAENLTLSSSQILVDPESGFASQSIPLTSVLGDVRNKVEGVVELSGVNKETIDVHGKQISLKASIGTESKLKEVTESVKGIEHYIEHEEKEGLNEVRRMHGLLEDRVDGQQVELETKVI